MYDFKEFVDLVYKTKDKALLEDFLLAITTSSERNTLARRIVIVRKLISGEAQKKIAKDLRVGVGTVSLGSKELKQGRFKILQK